MTLSPDDRRRLEDALYRIQLAMDKDEFYEYVSAQEMNGKTVTRVTILGPHNEGITLAIAK